MTLHLSIHGSGKPIVLFHGWGFDAKIWFPLLPLLTDSYRLYLVDLPGFGLTPQMDWEEFKSALLPKLPSCFAILGWSMGGLLATKLALDEPNRVSLLVNISSSPCFIRRENWPGVDSQMFRAFYNELTRDPARTLQQFIELQLHDQRLHLASLVGQPASLCGLHGGLELLLNLDLRDDLNDLTMPVFFMFGGLDSIIPRITMKKMQAMYPHFEYILFPKAAHALFLSHTDEFILAIERMMR